MAAETSDEVDNEHDGTIVVSVDLTEAFTTDKAFASHTDFIDWARHVGTENDYVVIVIRSDYGSAKRTLVITLGCERGGKYIPAAQVLKRNQTGTKKCDCPFRLRARTSMVDGRWKVIVHYGIHNHDTTETLQGHSFVGRLNPDEKAMVGSMIEKRVKPSGMLIALREKNPNNLTRIKQIYNEKQAYNRIQRFSKIQHLMKLLEGDKYAHWSRVEGGSNVIKSLFFAHPDSIHLFNEFPTVVLMDSTYKTNRVEGAHSKLKKFLIMQHDKIKESYQLIIFVTEHTHKDVFYKDLRGFVSRAALHMIARERKQIDPSIDPELGVSFESELETLKVKFDRASAAVRKSMIDCIRMISFPERTSMCPPPKKVPTKGRQKSSSKKVTAKGIKVPSERSTKRYASRWEHIDVQYSGSWEGSNFTPNTVIPPNRVKNQSLRPSTLRQILEEFHPFIDSLVHVKGDGHCRFRCVDAMLV
ncbi:uncharacterized protein LOC130730174 [Lotus japonicus]|uniref:uncharacterized protein LOC130730174 n=1 Tax=Lotus japonicus TaxID=34305 RepID=UPI00258B4B8F|nr:uncharacterized protein LOC130730174 [Lotus japonicus]